MKHIVEDLNTSKIADNLQLIADHVLNTNNLR